MFDLQTQAETIVAALKEIPAVKTAGYIDREDAVSKHPAELPAAFVTVDDFLATSSGTTMVTGPMQWAVMVRSKKMAGPSGCLPVLDLVASKLHGLHPGGPGKPLALRSLKFHEKKLNSIAFILRFSTGLSCKAPQIGCHT